MMSAILVLLKKTRKFFQITFNVLSEIGHFLNSSVKHGLKKHFDVQLFLEMLEQRFSC